MSAVTPALLAPYEGRLLIGSSGGADSTCLAHLALRRAREEGSELPLLLYVDHGLREDSAADSAPVGALAQHFGTELLVRRVQVGRSSSLEAAAREARYQAFEAVAAERQIDWLLLAHTRSDQAETVLMRVLRGTGLTGLAGMPERRGLFARPLLRVSRRDTEAYCQEHGLAFVEDPMNRDERFFRSRLRHRWLPALAEENPRVEDALVRLADEAGEHRQVLGWAADAFLVGAASERGLVLGPAWQQVPDAIAARALVRSAETAGLGTLEHRHLCELLALVRAPRAGSRELSLPGGTARREYDTLRWLVAGAAEADSPAPLEVEPGLRIRSWRPGDRMRPARLRGRSRKLSDLFADARVPLDRRRAARVVERESSGEIVWAEHLGAAHECEGLVRFLESP